MFDLETSIQNWKQAFGQDDSVGPAEVLELETHLRELVSDLGNRGLNEREAFMVGADRLGHPSELEHEYAKINFGAQWRKRIFWMLSGYIAMKVAGVVVGAVVAITGTGLAVSGVAGSISGAAMTVVMILAWCSCGLIFFRCQSQIFEMRKRRLWFVATGILLSVAPFIAYAGWAAQTRLVGPAWLGESLLYTQLAGIALNLGFVSACLIAMWRLSKSTMTTAQAE